MEKLLKDIGERVMIATTIAVCLNKRHTLVDFRPALHQRRLLEYSEGTSSSLSPWAKTISSTICREILLL